MTTKNNSRRNFFAGIASMVAGCSAADSAADVSRTAPAAQGPFYPRPDMRLPDIDNDLVRVSGLVERAGGEIFTLRGTLINRDGKALEGHRIEIWQCDVNGKYLHSGDRRDLVYDRAFQGFGQDTTDASGAYVFRTIKPTVYPGRSPHIHVKVFDGEQLLLTTQFYIKDHPDNSRDGLFRRLSATQADAVSMSFVESENGLESTVKLVV